MKKTKIRFTVNLEYEMPEDFTEDIITTKAFIFMRWACGSQLSSNSPTGYSNLRYKVIDDDA